MWDELAIEVLRGTPVWSQARRLIRLAREVNERVLGRRPGLDLGRLSVDRILDLFAGRWAADELELAAMDRGLDSTDGLVAAGRTCYLLARYNPDLTTGLKAVEEKHA
jgi:hypothetical protein